MTESYRPVLKGYIRAVIHGLEKEGWVELIAKVPDATPEDLQWAAKEFATHNTSVDLVKGVEYCEAPGCNYVNWEVDWENI